MVWHVTTRFGGAFGNGTRPAGFCFCKTSASDEQVHDAVAKALLVSGLKNLGIEFELEDGVTEDEAFQAVRNIHNQVCEIVSPVEISEVSVAVLELSDADKALLCNAGLDTIKKLTEFGEANDGFATIQGISKRADERITKAFVNYVKANENDSSSSNS